MRTWYRFENAVADPTVSDLYIYDVIGASFWDDQTVTAKQFLADLDGLPKAVKTIRVHVNSPGGNVFDAVAIANALRAQRVEKGRTVDMRIEGLAASAASIVTSAGSPIRMADNAVMMIHDPHVIEEGNSRALRKTADVLDRLRDAIVATYQWVSPLSSTQLAEMMAADTWMSADEAIGHGLATEKIAQTKPVAASVRPEILAQLKVPPRFLNRITASAHLGRPAASGTADPTSQSSAGVTASRASGSTDPTMKKTISERIADLRTARTTTANRMSALYAPVLDGTGELSADERTEYNTLKGTLTDTDEQIADLVALEQAAVMPTARAVRVDSIEDGSAARGAQASHVSNPKLNRPPEMEFVRMVICKVAGHLFGVSPLDVAKQRYPDEKGIHRFLNAAVAGGTTDDSTWAGPLTSVPSTLTSAFLDYLRPKTIVGQFGTGSIPSLTMTPFNVRIQSQTSGGSAGWVGQGKRKPVTKFDYDDVTLAWAKISGISVISDELVRFSSPSAEMRVRNALAATVIELMDRDFVDPNKSEDSNVSPASITNGLTPVSHTGTDADAVRADVKALLQTFIDANIDPTGLVWIMPNTIALALSLMRNALGQKEFPDVTMRGGMLEGFPVIASQYASLTGSPNNNLVIAANAPDIFLADDGGVSVDASRETSIAMSDDPENDDPTPISMFQSNQVALRAERYINWKRGREEAVAYMENVAWSA